MSRSRRKTPISGITTCRSERDDKKIWHGRWRARERTALAAAPQEALNNHLPTLENQVSDVWSMGKDGKCYFDPKRQAAAAERVASRMAQNSRERKTLKQRLLHKWISK